MSLEVTDEIVRLAYDLELGKHYLVAVVALLFYDIFTTLDQEIEVFWTQKKWNLARILWFLHRYYNAACFIILPVSYLLPSWNDAVSNACERFKHFPYAAMLISQLFISIILMLRTYALFGRDKRVLAIMVVAELCSLALQIYPLPINANSVLPPGLIGCIISGTPESGLSMITFHIGIAFFDCVIFALTMYKTMRLHREGMSMPVLNLLRRDGAIYFFIMTASNLIMIFTYGFAEPSLKSVNCAYAHVIAIVLVSHLMLNLKVEAGRRSSCIVHSSTPPSTRPTVAFVNSSSSGSTSTNTRRDTLSEMEQGKAQVVTFGTYEKQKQKQKQGEGREEKCEGDNEKIFVGVAL